MASMGTQYAQEAFTPKKKKNKARKEGMGTVTQKPTKNQDISGAVDKMGDNAKRSTKGGVRGNGMTVGMRF
jgi:hypothetical protein